MKQLLLLVVLCGIAQTQGFEVCKHALPGSLVGSPTNCREFFMCRTGRPVLFTCPPKMYFDVDTATCGYEAFCAENDVPEDEDLSGFPGPEFTPIVASPSQLEPSNRVCQGYPTGTIRLDVKGCNSFYQCSKEGPLRFDCPIGTLFDSNRLVCEAADLASCAIVPTKKPIAGGGTGGLLGVMCDGKKNGEKLAHPTNCQQYFVCRGHSKAQVFNCPPGTAYNKARKICDFEFNVTC